MQREKGWKDVRTYMGQRAQNEKERRDNGKDYLKERGVIGIHPGCVRQIGTYIGSVVTRCLDYLFNSLPSFRYKEENLPNGNFLSPKDDQNFAKF